MHMSSAFRQVGTCLIQPFYRPHKTQRKCYKKGHYSVNTRRISLRFANLDLWHCLLYASCANYKYFGIYLRLPSHNVKNALHLGLGRLLPYLSNSCCVMVARCCQEPTCTIKCFQLKYNWFCSSVMHYEKATYKLRYTKASSSLSPHKLKCTTASSSFRKSAKWLCSK